MNEMFTNIKNGVTTAEKVKAAIAASDSVAPEAVKAAYANISVYLDTFGKLAATQATALAKFQYDQSQKGITTLPAPTLEQARIKYYKDMGAPEQALLPDAGVGYAFDPSMFGNKKITDNISNLLAKQQELVASTAVGDAYAQKQADIYTQKGNADKAAKAGEMAKQAYLDKNPKEKITHQIDDWLSRNIQGAAYNNGNGPLDMINLPGYIMTGIGKLFGKDETSQRKKDAEKYGAETMQRVLAKLNSETVPVSIETKSQKRLKQLQDAQLRDLQYKQDVANLVSQKLMAAGHSPNQDTMNQLLSYAATVNKKK
jgi:hypothetical protein